SVDCSTHGSPSVIKGSSSAGLGASVTLGRDRFPVVSAVLSGGLATVYVIHCGAIDCSSFSTRMVLDTQAASNGETSIIIGKDGFPIVSYAGVMSMHPDLSIVHCTAMDCSTFDAPLVLEAPLNGGSYGGLYSSIGVGTDDFPIIAYSSAQGPNPGQTGLSTIHCATANCSSHG